MDKYYTVYENKLDGLRDKMSIDRNALEEEIVRQPQLYFEASELLTSINNRRDAIKEDLEVLGSEINLDLREQYDRDKVKYTEGSLKAEVQLDEDYEKLNKEYRLYKALSGKAQALQSAFETKTRMLSHLARLYVANYYSDPTVSTSQEQKEELEARRGRRAASKLRRRRD